MAGDISALVAEAKTLDLFRPHAAFEVHCSNCHTRLDPMGDCPTCGLLGRRAEDVEQRAQGNAAGAEKLLRGAIGKRRAFKPAKAARETA